MSNKNDILTDFNRARHIHQRMKKIRSAVRELLLELEAYVTLCDDCHAELEGIRKRQAKRFEGLR
ncbi:MAG: hypothetical protein QME66_10430 [Candidatus Eisenbacteria bacterium]|nr:hypothetical protein [Candidatus Eisenbacteria bacterium]